MNLLYGWDPHLYDPKWLQEDPKRKLVVLLEKEAVVPAHPQICSYLLTSPLQVEMVAHAVAQEAVFLDVTLEEGRGKTQFFPLFQQAFTKHHLSAHLRLSDAADYGVIAVQNAYACRERTIHSVWALQDAFCNVPAVIAGAGPSLPSLKAYAPSALIFAGGAALERIDVVPDFAAAIDKEGPLQKIPARSVPFCFQSRLERSILQKIKGPLLRAPESHFPFIRWLEGEEEAFDAGWTVGNFLTALAVLWGCNPILFAGLDFCYQDGKKYANSESSSTETLVLAKNRQGEKVFTQRDWLMAAQWTEEWAKQHPNRTFIDLTARGLDLGASIQVGSPSLPILTAKPRFPSLTSLKNSQERWKRWREELAHPTEFLEKILLEPLWQIWKPIFAREVRTDKELAIHQTLFYQRVRKEHLDAIAAVS